MSENQAQYSCDACRSRKVACSRDQSGCQRCKAESIVCTYSRSGVIRRNRRQKKQLNPVNVETSAVQSPPQRTSEASDASTHARLQRLVGKDHPSLRVLASLLEEHAAAWQDSSAFDSLADGAQSDYFQFEDGQIRSWFDVFIATVQKEKLMLPYSQSDLLEHLLASRPHQLHNRAWFVMFYCVILSTTNTPDVSAKLKRNLWLFFNDVRLLLEPTIPNIQALVILVCYAEEFMTPSICWMLVSKACMMLQAIDTTHGRLDSAMREWRNKMFWRLNTLDKALALILCKTPNLPREMASSIPMPSLDQLLTSLPGCSSNGAPVLFDAHYMHQMHLMSSVMADVWNCLYGQDSHKVLEVKERLEIWHHQATEVLEAAALAEKPLLPANIAMLIDFGLETLHCHYYYLLVLIKVSCKQPRAQSIYPSLQLLRLLPSLGQTATTSLRQPYCCLLWHQLHCPLAAFGTIWGEIVIKGESDPHRIRQFLVAIECLPAYLLQLGSRNSLAIKLSRIVEKIVRNLQLILSLQDEGNNLPRRAESPIPNGPPSGMDESNGVSDAQRVLPELGTTIETPDTWRAEAFDFEVDGLFTWPDDGFLNATVDWFTQASADLE